MLNRDALATALATVLFCTTISNDALAAPFQVGEFITYSQDSWGTLSTNASDLLLNNFFVVYPNGIEVGISGVGGNSMIFSSPENALDYIPTSRTPGQLDNDLVDPLSTSAGVFGGDVLANQFNVDFNDAGFLAGSADIRFGDLTMVNFATIAVQGVPEDFSHLNGLSVRQFLAAANICLGDGFCSNTYEGMTFIARSLSLAFDEGTPTQFAQDHLQLPAGPVPTPVPEPATLSLLGIGLAALTARHRSRVGRDRLCTSFLLSSARFRHNVHAFLRTTKAAAALNSR